MNPHFSLSTLEKSRLDEQKNYLEFLRVPDMSAGLYVLEVGATDLQQPHSEDEIYVVLEGKAQIRVADKDYPACVGDTIFVPAKVVHYFHSILETLKVIVIFAPAEYARQGL